MRFRNREEAARLLAQRLQHYRGQHPLVLGIARGGVPLAKVLADQLGGDLDVVLVEKLRLPSHPEQTLGAVDEDGNVYTFADNLHAGPEEVAREIQARLEDLQRRRMWYSSVQMPIPIRGRVVIVVDDGVATGSSMVAAIRAIRGHRPRRVVAAVPVAAPESLRAVKAHADEVACLHTPKLFRTVAHNYDHLPVVTDDMVQQLLSASGSSHLPV